MSVQRIEPEVAVATPPPRPKLGLRALLRDVNRRIEAEVAGLGGHKSLYSEAYYDESTFWSLYGGATYEQVKRKYDPDGRLPDLYAKAVGRR